MIPVRGGEGPVVVIIAVAEAEGVPRRARVPSYRQPVAQPLARHPKLCVLSELHLSVKVLQLYTQRHVSFAGQLVDHVVAQPELAAVQLAEARAVLGPGAIEVHAAVLPPLQHGPPSALQLHVAVDREASAAEVRGHQVDPAPSEPLADVVRTVSLQRGHCGEGERQSRNAPIHVK